MDFSYIWDSGHLWFLANIFAYVLLLAPFFYLLKTIKTSRIRNIISLVLGHPLGLVLVAAALVGEAMVLNPIPYELYAKTWHGFFLGMLAFFFGYCFVLAGTGFWTMIQKWRWVWLVLAGTMFWIRTFYFGTQTPLFFIPVESLTWVVGMISFGCSYLNKPSQALAYLSEAAYPIYIVHMIFLYLGSLLIFSLDLSVQLQFVLLLSFTILGCFLAYEGIRRLEILRLLFGLKKKNLRPIDL